MGKINLGKTGYYSISQTLVFKVHSPIFLSGFPASAHTHTYDSVLLYKC